MEIILVIGWFLTVLIPVNGLILIGQIQYYKKIRRAIQMKLELVKYRRK